MHPIPGQVASDQIEVQSSNIAIGHSERGPPSRTPFCPDDCIVDPVCDRLSWLTSVDAIHRDHSGTSRDGLDARNQRVMQAPACETRQRQAA